MCNKENLPNRVMKANAAKLFAKVVQTDENGNALIVLVPGTEGKRYRVSFIRAAGLLHAVCDNIGGDVPVQCISHARVPCYHTMAAVQVAAELKHRTVIWCANEADATNLSNLYVGGTLFSVTMVATGSRMFGVQF